MTARAMAAAALVTCMAASACRNADAEKAARADSNLLAKREARLESSLRRRDTSAADSTADRKPVARWVLPRDLDEISGIAMTPDGRMLAESDEHGRITELDYRRGTVVKQFGVGHPTLKGDFEGITVVNDVVFLLESNGTLYEFREGANGAHVDYTTHDTRLGKECEFEGLAYDSTLGSLLLACKNVGTKNLRDYLVIYRWKIARGDDRLSQLKVPLEDILSAIGEKELHPSDITIDPLNGNYLLVASIEKAMVEITPDGKLVFARKLPRGHDQAEAVAITRDSILIVGDEAKHNPAGITLYPWP